MWGWCLCTTCLRAEQKSTTHFLKTNFLLRNKKSFTLCKTCSNTFFSLFLAYRLAIEIKNKSFQILFLKMFFSSPRIKKHFPHEHSQKGRAGIQYNAGKTEALSLETVIRMSLTWQHGEEEQDHISQRSRRRDRLRREHFTTFIQCFYPQEDLKKRIWKCVEVM